MEQNNEFEIIISEGKRSWYEIVLAAVFFSVPTYLILITLYDVFVYLNIDLFLGEILSVVKVGGFCLPFAIRFSLIKDILIDTDKNKLVSRYKIGLFSHDIVSKIDKFEYISVFKDAKEIYQTLLWYTANRHYEMYCFEEEKPAFDFALLISNKLNIDLLDATEKGNFQWIDKTKL